MKCPICGRFMRSGGYFANDHNDSWEDVWSCTVRHPSPEEKARAASRVNEARIGNREREAAETRALFAAIAAIPPTT